MGSVGPSEGVGDCVQSPRLLALITSLSALMLQVFVMPLFALGWTELSHEGCLKTKLPGEKSGGW